jgi:hypothetical protein
MPAVICHFYFDSARQLPNTTKPASSSLTLALIAQMGFYELKHECNVVIVSRN